MIMDQMEEEIQQLCSSSIELFNAGDYEGVAKLYKEETQFLAPYFSRITTRAGVSEFWKSTFNAGYRFQKVETIEIRTSGDLAYWLFNWVMTNPDKDGGIITQTGKNVLIWERVESEWLVCLDSWNTPA
jgi:ketosteroid isomerase-like protein